MIWFALAGGIILLVLCIWKPLVRHIINTFIIWALQIITWGLQGAGWVTGMTLFLFQVIDGRHPVNNIKFGSAKETKTEPAATLKTPDIDSIDLNNPEQVAKFVRENKDYIKIINNATGG